MDKQESEAVARFVCEEMERRMREMGVVTTAHYDAGLPLIAAALRDVFNQGAVAMRKRAAELAEGFRPRECKCDDCASSARGGHPDWFVTEDIADAIRQADLD